MVATEDEAFDRARRFLSYLPSNVDELPPRGPATTTPTGATTAACRSCPATRAGSTRCAIIDRVGRSRPGPRSSRSAGGWGKSIITGLARLDGWPVALFAEDPYVYGGAWTADAVAQGHPLHRPGLHLPPAAPAPRGLPRLPHRQAVRAGGHHPPRLDAPSPRSASRTSPFCCRRDPQGVRRGRRRQPQAGHATSATRGRRATGARCRSRAASRWPTRPSWREARRSRRASGRITERLNRYRSPFRAAEVFDIEEIIDPRDTRPLLCRWADLVARVRRGGPAGRTVPTVGGNDDHEGSPGGRCQHRPRRRVLHAVARGVRGRRDAGGAARRAMRCATSRRCRTCPAARRG